MVPDIGMDDGRHGIFVDRQFSEKSRDQFRPLPEQ